MVYKIIYIKGIGEIKLIKKTNIRRLSIKVVPFDGVIVNIPHRISYLKAEQFVGEKQLWIKKSLQRIEEIEERRTIFNENSDFRTKTRYLVVEKGKNVKFYSKINHDKIWIKYPQKFLVSDEKVQKYIRKIIERSWLAEANEILPERTILLAKKFGFKVNSVKINNTVSRWGSCSYNNEIKLSLHLMRLPNYLVDYIILHELCHIVVKNHSKTFWNLLNKLSGNARGLDKELKNYSAKIY